MGASWSDPYDAAEARKQPCSLGRAQGRPGWWLGALDDLEESVPWAGGPHLPSSGYKVRKKSEAKRDREGQ